MNYALCLYHHGDFYFNPQRIKQICYRTMFFVKLACGKARHDCYNFCSVYVSASIQICPGHNFSVHVWISK